MHPISYRIPKYPTVSAKAAHFSTIYFKGVEAMSNDVRRTHLVYQGPLGLVIYEGASFFASKDGFPIGTCDTLEEAMEKLAWKARPKAFLPAYQPHVHRHRGSE
jgi:hypothetical protein